MPPVKRLLPPRSSAEAFSSTSTCAPASHAARAAVKAALPAPTTTTSLNSSGSSTLSLRVGYHAGHIGCQQAARCHHTTFLHTEPFAMRPQPPRRDNSTPGTVEHHSTASARLIQ